MPFPNPPSVLDDAKPPILIPTPVPFSATLPEGQQVYLFRGGPRVHRIQRENERDCVVEVHSNHDPEEPAHFRHW